MTPGQELALALLIGIVAIRWLIPDASGTSKIGNIWQAAWHGADSTGPTLTPPTLSIVPTPSGQQWTAPHASGTGPTP